MKAKIVVRGSSVQDVGYRLFLLERAGTLSGFEAINTAEGLAVMIEGNARAVGVFVEAVTKERPPDVRVTSVDTEKYTGFVMRAADFRAQFKLELLTMIATNGLWGWSR